jgi:hypothetical protein
VDRNGTIYEKEPENRYSTISGYIFPNIQLHHYPRIMVDHD